MVTFIFLALALCDGCGGLPEGTVRIGPELTVTLNGTPRHDREYLIAYEVADEFAFRKCRRHLTMINYDVIPGKFPCGAVAAAEGCYPMSPQGILRFVYHARVGYSAVGHEFMHHIYTLCEGHDGTDGFNNHSTDFLRDANEVEAVLLSRLEPE